MKVGEVGDYDAVILARDFVRYTSGVPTSKQCFAKVQCCSNLIKKNQRSDDPMDPTKMSSKNKKYTDKVRTHFPLYSRVKISTAYVDGEFSETKKCECASGLNRDFFCYAVKNKSLFF